MPRLFGCLVFFAENLGVQLLNLSFTSSSSHCSMHVKLYFMLKHHIPHSAISFPHIFSSIMPKSNSNFTYFTKNKKTLTLLHSKLQYHILLLYLKNLTSNDNNK